MKQVLVRSGAIVVDEVPAPSAGPKEILVRVAYSCVSSGTELAGLKMSAVPLYRRALKQPEHVRRAMEMIRDQGVLRTWQRISGKLAAGSATGYSVAGEIVGLGAEVDGFHIGDHVACAGAGIANHAELVNVPVNLAVHVPPEVTLADASTVTLGAIALQGLRRCQPTLGETVVVVGLGLLGQLTAQILRANGCRVLGVDVNRARIDIAVQSGLAVGLTPSEHDWVTQVHHLTNSMGADAVIITASSSSPQVISDAMKCCRRKGRVVVVGDVNLQIERADMYAKELDLLISTSYGPGRYDPLYEEGGQDYPLAYVRWTENRNMAAYLGMIANGAVRLEALRTGVFEIDSAAQAYDSLKADSRMIAVLAYPVRADAAVCKVQLRSISASKDTRLRVALIGAGGFAQAMHLPNLVKLRRRFVLRAVMSRTGANAKAVATQYEAAYATTSLDEVLGDPEVDLAIIATRHDQHADMALRGLRAGKHVLVEKPLALREEELLEIERFYEERKVGDPVLMTGFNRRFSPAIKCVRDITGARSGPLIVNYRMNAGFIPPGHWVHGPEGGGRNIGEACHIYDLFNHLVGETCQQVSALGVDSKGGTWLANDNFVATLRYPDGSVCSLTYTALGNRSYPKEQMEVFVDGRVIVMSDFKSTEIIGGRGTVWRARTPHKGQFEELEALSSALSGGGEWPIPLAHQLDATRTSFEVERQLRRGRSGASEA